jgi:hypothetical protein
LAKRGIGFKDGMRRLQTVNGATIRYDAGLNHFEILVNGPGCELAASQTQTLPIATPEDDRAPSKF